jgi:hypothetical protein
MYQGKISLLFGIATAALLALPNSATSQGQQKSAKELIAGNWTLMIADNVSRDDHNVPGLGPLPKGSARFSADGRYSFQVASNADAQPVISAAGTYTLDDTAKTLTFKVDESSVANWKGTTQTGTLKFVSGDHLGWTNSPPLVSSTDFKGTDLIWERAK